MYDWKRRQQNQKFPSFQMFRLAAGGVGGAANKNDRKFLGFAPRELVERGRGVLVRVGTFSERTHSNRNTARAARTSILLAALPLEKGSRKGYNFTAKCNFSVRKGGNGRAALRRDRGGGQKPSSLRDELERGGNGKAGGFVSCFVSKIKLILLN